MTANSQISGVKTLEVVISSCTIHPSTTNYNKPGRTNLVPRSRFTKIKRHYCQNVIKCTELENTQRDTHKTQKPLFPTGNTKNINFSKINTSRKKIGSLIVPKEELQIRRRPFPQFLKNSTVPEDQKIEEVNRQTWKTGFFVKKPPQNCVEKTPNIF